MTEYELKGFMELIASAFSKNKKADNIPGLNWNEIYNFSLKHAIANIIAYATEDMELPEDISQKLKTRLLIDLKNDTIQNYEISTLLDLYEAEGIECVVLKGTILKGFYPTPDMRVMGDLDLLVKKEQLPKAHEILIKNGYTEIVEDGQNKETNPHEEYIKPPVMLVELHKFLFPKEGFEDIFEHYEHIWEMVVPYKNYKNIYMLNENEFYIYMILHLMKHYKRAGTGIRSLLDIWVYTKKIELNEEYIENTLKSLGYLKFEKNIKELCYIWFEGKKSDNPLFFEMTNYIFDSGVYGTAKNLKTLDIQKKSNTSGIRYILSVVFLPYKSMCMLYPRLKKMPFLLPYYWLIRGLDKFFRQRNRVKKEIEISMDSGYSKQIINHLKDVGLWEI